MYFWLYLVVYLHLSIANNTCNVTVVISVVYLHLSIANNTCNVTVVISVVYLQLSIANNTTLHVLLAILRCK
jgi:hypothetical protein